MTPKDFGRIARTYGLTRHQLLTLNLCQSHVYHAIRFDGAQDVPDTTFALNQSCKGPLRRSLGRLHDLGIIAIDTSTSRCSVTAKGWSIPCNAGASIFVTGCSEADLLGDQPVAPLRRFGPQFAD